MNDILNLHHHTLIRKQMCMIEKKELPCEQIFRDEHYSYHMTVWGLRQLVKRKKMKGDGLLNIRQTL
jgi:hypothetical protein